MDTDRVMFSISELKINSAVHFLNEAGIVSFVIDKTDSAYAGIFGHIELYVSTEESDRAREVLIREDIIEE